MKKLIFLFILSVVVVVAKVKNWVYEPGNLQNPVRMVVSRGSSVVGISNQLENFGVIDKPWLFRLAARYYRLDTSLKAGEYEFLPRVSMFQVIEKMVRGDIVYHKITLPEGLTTKQMLEIIRADDDLRGEITLNPKEGELLPETYSFVYGDTKDSIIKQAEDAMKKASVYGVRRGIFRPFRFTVQKKEGGRHMGEKNDAFCTFMEKEDVFAVAVKVGLNRKDAVAEFDKMEKCIFGSVSDGR